MGLTLWREAEVSPVLPWVRSRVSRVQGRTIVVDQGHFVVAHEPALRSARVEVSGVVCPGIPIPARKDIHLHHLELHVSRHPVQAAACSGAGQLTSVSIRRRGEDILAGWAPWRLCTLIFVAGVCTATATVVWETDDQSGRRGWAADQVRDVWRSAGGGYG